jgi:hypothetical protein
MSAESDNKNTVLDTISKVAVESRYLQNQAYSRDFLPHALSVKQYYLQLKQISNGVDFEEIGLSIFSQNNEDGILLYLFSQIGMTSKRSIEIGCDLTGSTVGIPEGNSINLIVNFGFDGLIVDIDKSKTDAIRHFFAQCLSTKHFHRPASDTRPAGNYSPGIECRQVSADNINDIFAKAGFVGEVDLLSIDTDGADVKMWQSVDVVTPRIVMVEVNNRLPFDQPIYGSWSSSTAPSDSLAYQQSWGSSLAAACEVASEKGYIFAGMDLTLINAFFVRKDVWVPSLRERAISDYTRHRFNPMLRTS